MLSDEDARLARALIHGANNRFNDGNRLDDAALMVFERQLSLAESLLTGRATAVERSAAVAALRARVFVAEGAAEPLFER